jgi:hypothetical protein
MKFALLFAFITAFHFVYSQTTENIVTLTTSGTGKTIEEAKNNALRSAIEQAFGAFISSKTEILNDEIVSDQITSVASGNIQKYEIKSENLLPNGLWNVTISCIVSVDKLISFVQSKGINVEIKGGLFSLNIKQQILNEKAELNAVLNLFEIIFNNFSNSFDFQLNAGNPVSVDNSNQNWEIPLNLSLKANSNFQSYEKIFRDYLSSLSLSNEELASYQALNKTVYKIIVSNDLKRDEFYLRSSKSQEVLVTLGLFMESFQNNFVVKNDIGNLKSPVYTDETGWRYMWHHKQKIDFFGGFRNGAEFYFPNEGAIIRESSVSDFLKLSEMEKIQGYKVIRPELVSKYEYGGISIKDSTGKRIVLSIITLDKLNWNEAKFAAESFNVQGYRDFQIPTVSDYKILKDLLNIVCDYRLKEGFYTANLCEDNPNQVIKMVECFNHINCSDKNEIIDTIWLIRK